ncbi:hypothetical protein ABT236_24490 [Streptomyces sp. NPDC001523]|uniref:hypothetical protein n=1 Tax=Streptomyces sp. NPDC001523 TaxID=3154383 RepID=UPI003324BB2C
MLLRVRLAGRRPKPAADGTIPLVWLVAQWPEDEAEPVKYRISNLPTGIPAKDLVRLVKTRWRIEHDYRELKTATSRTMAIWNRFVAARAATHFSAPMSTHPSDSPRRPGASAAGRSPGSAGV